MTTAALARNKASITRITAEAVPAQAFAELPGTAVPPMSWGLCIGMALVGCGFTAWLYRRAHARIAYWV